MNRLRWLVVILVAGCGVAWLAAQNIPRDRTMTTEQLADNLFVVKDGYDGNTAVFIRAEGVVLVDTKSVAGGQALLDAVRTLTDKPVTHILNTHEHFDHVGGNSYLPQHVEVVAHENAAAAMAGMDEFRGSARAHGLPDRTFKDTLTLFDGADAISLHYFGRAHTTGDAFIVFRGAGVMHAGDTYPGVNVVQRSGGSADEYPRTMSRAASEITGVRSVIPGHGPVTTWQAFVDNAAALRKGRD
ncbi:MAG TPA: MBL fold metallo-hydrolase [Vicinamibacterales bacterium]|nr:MBL fold metallo-hydrolase [Vicinamibacterales bacterium]